VNTIVALSKGRRSGRRLVLGAFALLAVASLGCASKPKPKSGSEVGLSAPEFSLKDARGQTVRLSDFAGKVVIVDFWATWCPPCVREVPGFVALQKKYADRGVVVVGISVDQSWDPIGPFAARNGVNYPIVLGNQEVATAYRVDQGIPTTFVVDQDGVIRLRHVGFAAPETFTAAIEPLL
jgi:peroxiredoxin